MKAHGSSDPAAGYHTTRTHEAECLLGRSLAHMQGSGAGPPVRVRTSSEPRDQVGTNEGYETCPFINLQGHTTEGPSWGRNPGRTKAETKSPANALDRTLPKTANTQ